MLIMMMVMTMMMNGACFCVITQSVMHFINANNKFCLITEESLQFDIGDITNMRSFVFRSITRVSN